MDSTPSNRWSCLAKAFSYMLGVPLAELIAEIGHDGSQIIDASLPEPFKRRSFHIQEMIDAALRRGVSVTEIQRVPVSGTTSHIVYNMKVAPNRFTDYLSKYDGVIATRTSSNVPHAMCVQHGVIFDPWTKIPMDVKESEISKFWILTEF